MTSHRETIERFDSQVFCFERFVIHRALNLETISNFNEEKDILRCKLRYRALFGGKNHVGDKACKILSLPGRST